MKFVSGILAIRNEKTAQSSESDELVLSASSYLQQEKTDDQSQDAGVSTPQRTPSLQLSESESHTENTERYTFPKSSSTDESFDLLTASKHIDQIDGNNIESRSGDYSR